MAQKPYFTSPWGRHQLRVGQSKQKAWVYERWDTVELPMWNQKPNGLNTSYWNLERNTYAKQRCWQFYLFSQNTLRSSKVLPTQLAQQKAGSKRGQAPSCMWLEAPLSLSSPPAKSPEVRVWWDFLWALFKSRGRGTRLQLAPEIFSTEYLYCPHSGRDLGNYKCLYKYDFHCIIISYLCVQTPTRTNLLWTQLRICPVALTAWQFGWSPATHQNVPYVKWELRSPYSSGLAENYRPANSQKNTAGLDTIGKEEVNKFIWELNSLSKTSLLQPQGEQKGKAVLCQETYSFISFRLPLPKYGLGFKGRSAQLSFQCMCFYKLKQLLNLWVSIMKMEIIAKGYWHAASTVLPAVSTGSQTPGDEETSKVI